MKTFLISITSDCQGVAETYLKTIDKIGDSAEPIMVTFNPKPPKHEKIKTIHIDRNYPGNLDRFNYFPQGFEDEDMIIFTDASDVIFQAPIEKLDTEVIYLCNEWEKWGDDNWWKDKLEAFNFHELDGFYIFNMGSWAMSYANVKRLLDFIKENRSRFKDWVASDQVLFNWWLSQFPHHIETKRPATPFECLYNSLEKGKIEQIGDKFYDDWSRLVPIIHANGGIYKNLLIKKG